MESSFSNKGFTGYMLEVSKDPRVAPDCISDKQLLLGFVNGDESAFQRIIERHAEMVRSVCHRILRNPSDCEDAFQATIIAVTHGDTLIVEGDDDALDRKPESIELPSDAILRISGMPADRSDLIPGMSVPLELGTDAQRIHAIEAEVEASQIVEGELTAIDSQTQELTLAIDEDNDRYIERTFMFAESAIIIRDSAHLRFEDLSLGAHLKLRLNADKSTVRSIKVLPREHQENPWQGADD